MIVGFLCTVVPPVVKEWMNLQKLLLCHLNIQGLKSKLYEIPQILDSYNPHILGISEAGLDIRDSIPCHDLNYDFIPGFCYSQVKTRAGVYVRKGLKYKIRI